MAGELALYDVTRYNPIAADYLNAIPANDVSSAGIVWVKNVGSSQVSGMQVSIVIANGSDGASMMKLSAGTPIAAPAIAPAAAIVAGSIAGPTTRYYVLAALGVADGPTLPSPSVEVPIPNPSSGVSLSWAPVANALGYAIYISADNVDFYLLDRVYGGTTYSDLTGLVDTSAERAVTLNQAFREGLYVAGPLDIGDLDPGAMRPVIYRAEVPAGTTPALNTRSADIVIEGTTV